MSGLFVMYGLFGAPCGVVVQRDSRLHTPQEFGGTEVLRYTEAMYVTLVGQYINLAGAKTSSGGNPPRGIWYRSYDSILLASR